MNVYVYECRIKSKIITFISLWSRNRQIKRGKFKYSLILNFLLESYSEPMFSDKADSVTLKDGCNQKKNSTIVFC